MLKRPFHPSETESISARYQRYLFSMGLC
jgi:hypothetical protein